MPRDRSAGTRAAPLRRETQGQRSVPLGRSPQVDSQTMTAVSRRTGGGATRTCRPWRRRKSAHGQRAARAGAAARTRQRVQPVLVDVGLDLRQLCDLMTVRLGVIASEPVLAFPTSRRLAVGHGPHLLGREQLPVVTLVSGLPARFASRRGLGIARDCRGIARRRLARIARRDRELLFQIRDARHQLGDHALQLGDPTVTPVALHDSDLQQPPHNGKAIRRPLGKRISHSRE